MLFSNPNCRHELACLCFSYGSTAILNVYNCSWKTAIVSRNCVPKLTFSMVSLQLWMFRAAPKDRSCDSQLRPRTCVSLLFQWFHYTFECLDLLSGVIRVTPNCASELTCSMLSLQRWMHRAALNDRSSVFPNGPQDLAFPMVSQAFRMSWRIL